MTPPPHSSFRPPNSSFPRSKACPVPRYGGGNPRTNIPRKNANRDTTAHVHTATSLRLAGKSTHRTQIRGRNPGVERRHNCLSNNSTNRRPDFHTLVCRHQPACAIAMKACPGLRSGIKRSGSLSFAIRGIPSSIRPPIRHSGEGRNPGGVGRGKATRRWKKPTRRPTFIPWCARASRHERLVRNGEKAPAQLPKRRREPTHRKTRQRRASAQDVVIGCVLERTGKGSTVQAIRSHKRMSIDTFTSRYSSSLQRFCVSPGSSCKSYSSPASNPWTTTSLCTAQCAPLSETREDLDR